MKTKVTGHYFWERKQCKDQNESKGRTVLALCCSFTCDIFSPPIFSVFSPKTVQFPRLQKIYCTCKVSKFIYGKCTNVELSTTNQIKKKSDSKSSFHANISTKMFCWASFPKWWVHTKSVYTTQLVKSATLCPPYFFPILHCSLDQFLLYLLIKTKIINSFWGSGNFARCVLVYLHQNKEIWKGLCIENGKAMHQILGLFI